MSISHSTELINAFCEISNFAPALESPFDRVRLAEWVRRLTELSRQGDISLANQYAQLMRIQVRAGTLRSPFLSPPPHSVPPLPVSLGDEILENSSLPAAGPVAPFMSHKSKDGHAYVSARQIPGQGVLCYLAVSTNPMEFAGSASQK